MHMHPPALEHYIAEARPYPELWRLGLGFVLILLMQAGFIALMIMAALPVVGGAGLMGWLADLAVPDSPGDVLFLLAGFIGMGGAVLIVAPACHYRSPGSLMGPAREVLRGFWAAVIRLLPVYAGVFVLSGLITPPEPNLPLARWLALLPLALPLVLIQTSAEELLFRGYLMQQLAARFAARAVWMGLPAVIFTLLHAAPGAGWVGGALLMVPILAFALAAADLTVRSGNLGLAMGWHFINNCSALLLVSIKGTITGLALYTTPYGVNEGALSALAIAANLLAIWLMWRLLRPVANR